MTHYMSLSMLVFRGKDDFVSNYQLSDLEKMTPAELEFHFIIINHTIEQYKARVAAAKQSIS